jgi:hypothetical protein
MSKPPSKPSRELCVLPQFFPTPSKGRGSSWTQTRVTSGLEGGIYCATRRELFAIVTILGHFHKYLYGKEFHLRTDHSTLTWLMNFKNIKGQTARWIQRLQEYNFISEHRQGRKHNNADALSRRPCQEQCNHCQKVEARTDTKEVRAIAAVSAAAGIR